MENGKVLESWKQIASYLNRSEKTCRRFAQELGLPIHRLEETPKARVFAYTEEIDRWIKETQHSDKEIPPKKPIWQRLALPALVLASVSVIALTFWLVLRTNGDKALLSGLADKPSLAVLYFKNSTGDSDLDFWRSALAQSIITDLHQSQHIMVLREDRLFGILKDLDLLEAQGYTTDELKRIASEGRARYLLLGSFSRAGDTFRIETTLQDVQTGEVLDSERIEGRGEESFFSMIDELTRRVKLSLDIPPKIVLADIDRNIEDITTSSPEALKYYSEGVEILMSGNPQKSVENLEKAIAIDPDFAMAYRALGAAYSPSGDIEKKKMYRQKAFELSDRVSEREKYVIQGTHYLGSDKTLDKAIEAYENLLYLYPDDLVGLMNLALLYSDIGKIDQAIELSAEARKLFPENLYVHCNFAFYYFIAGMYDKAEDILRDYEKNISEDQSYIKQYLAFSFLFRNQYDLALAEIEKSLALIPTNWAALRTKGDIYLFKGDYLEAERVYSQLLENEESIQFGRARLGAHYLLLGRIEDSVVQIETGLEQQRILGRNSQLPDFYLQSAYRCLRAGENERALELCDEALNYAKRMEMLSWQNWALYFKGLTLIEGRQVEDAQRVAVELRKVVGESLNDKDIRWHDHLLGLIKLEGRSYSSAIAYFEKAISLLNFEGHWCDDLHALFFEPLARAYYGSGNLERARQEYEKIISLTKGRLYYGDIYAKSFVGLGEIYEQLGDKRKAIENYETFLDLWRDADPGLAEIQDVKTRLSELNQH